ncbi:hypothetical protein K1719_025129 [Acacia pycnantha]|nr:hypothetical protein K1719_025129 [Acacia pycnantha]
MDNRVNPMKASEAWMEWLMKDVTWAKVHVQADTQSPRVQAPSIFAENNHAGLTTETASSTKRGKLVRRQRKMAPLVSLTIASCSQY